jgi:alpha-glucuronidase
MAPNGAGDTLADIVTGPLGTGMAAVSNLGNDNTWAGVLGVSNTYAFGRLAWDPMLAFDNRTVSVTVSHAPTKARTRAEVHDDSLDDGIYSDSKAGADAASTDATSADAASTDAASTTGPSQIVSEWVDLTFGHDPLVRTTVHSMLMTSWEVYENYTSPLGVGFTCGGDHFTPNPSNRNDQYIHTSNNGTGYDRTTATGSKYAGEYNGLVAANFESPTACPAELLLFFHHVPFSQPIRYAALESMRQRSRGGKPMKVLGAGMGAIEERSAAVDASASITLIDYIYESHRSGVKSVQEYVSMWAALKGRAGMDDASHAAVARQLTGQVEQATKWCQAMTSFFEGKKSVAHILFGQTRAALSYWHGRMAQGEAR